MTNIPAIQFTDTGLILPTETSILNGAFVDIDDAFGGGVKQNLKTPQGQLATSIAKIVADKNEEIAYVTNQVDPDYADGLWQDAIGRIYFLERKTATPTVVVCECGGEAGKIIAAGSKATDLSGNVYFCVDGGTIPSGGVISLNFQNLKTGPIPCPANSLIYIYQADSGWDTITNAGTGVPGTDVEGRAEFEARRRASVALNAHGSKESIYSAVFNVADVTDCYVTENVTSSPVDVGVTDYAVAGHSVYVAVVGGSNEDVAQAIASKKDLGCNMNGDIEVTAYDYSYSAPYPEYTIKFVRPSALAIKIAVSIVAKSTLPSDIATQIKEAIVSAFSGGDGGERARIGGTIYASRFYASVALVHSSVAIISVLIGTATATLTSVVAGIDQVPTIQASDITVTVS